MHLKYHLVNLSKNTVYFVLYMPLVAATCLPFFTMAEDVQDKVQLRQDFRASCDSPDRGPQGIRGSQGPQGLTGPQGYRGYTGPVGEPGPSNGILGPVGGSGPMGPVGPTGPTGSTGPVGDIGPGAIIPYASGISVGATANASPPGNSLYGAIIGFGTAIEGVDVSTGVIDLTGSPYSNYAFSVPRSGTITDMAVTLTTASPYTINPQFGLNALAITITAELYIASNLINPNQFNPTGITVTISSPPTSPPVSIPLGTVFTGSSSSFYSVDVTDRLLMVYTYSVLADFQPGFGPLGSTEFFVYFSGGVTIE